MRPIFAGEHIRLATAREADRTIFADWTNDDAYMRMLDDDPVRPQSVANFDNFGAAVSDDNYYFHLRTLSDDMLIGFVG
ncbi:MAG: hypothetical protein ACPG7F_07090 [Aggregatilineales bacterium]